MNFYRTLFVVAVWASGAFLVTGGAGAIPLPDTGSSCSSSGACLKIANTSTSLGGMAVRGDDARGIGVYGSTAFGVGIYGSATGSGGVAVFGTSPGVAVRASSSGSSNAILAENTDTTGSAAAISALSSNASTGLAYWGTGGIQITGGAWKTGGGSWSVLSDARIKKDVHSLSWGLDQLREVRPVTYKYNGLGGAAEDGRLQVGVIAQELEKIFPEMVTTRKAKLHPTDATQTDIKVVDPSAFTFVLINAVKEQQALIERQERRIASIEQGGNSSLASVLGGGVETCLAFGWLPLGYMALRRRKQSK